MFIYPNIVTPSETDSHLLKVIYSLRMMTFVQTFTKHIGGWEYSLSSLFFWLLKVNKIVPFKGLWLCVQYNGLKVWLSEF